MRRIAGVSIGTLMAHGISINVLILGVVRPTLDRLLQQSFVFMDFMALGAMVALRILPWQLHVLQSVPVTLPLLQMVLALTGTGVARVLGLL